MPQVRWEVLNKEKSAGKQSVHKLVKILLKNRGLNTKKDIDEFLSPPYPGKFKLKELGVSKKSLARACLRIKKAIKNNEHVLIYGDYDADGICATAILWEKLHLLGANATPFVPDRFNDGYGINAKSVKNLKEKYPDVALIITVDNGIVAIDGIKSANALGIDVIITDHHAKKKETPKAYAIIHTTKTSGSGVSWILSQTLKKDSDGVELCAIGTIADQMPLLGFNRSLAKYGIEILNTTHRPGLRKLFAVAGILGKRIGTYEVNYAIIPRINASGRLGTGMDALRLLCTTNHPRAQKLAVDLNNLNVERQKKVEEALDSIKTTLVNQQSSVIFLGDENFHEGIIGLIASRISEKHYKPVIVFSKGETIAKGSARSVEGFNIIEAIRFAEDLIIEGGGHSGAAGFSIELKNITMFQSKVEDYSKVILSKIPTDRKITADCQIQFNQINHELYNKLVAFEPHGQSNPAPVFMSEGVRVVSARGVGKKSEHQKLVLEQDGVKMNGIIFNHKDKMEKTMDFMYKLNLNEWNGKASLEIMVKDVRIAN